MVMMSLESDQVKPPSPTATTLGVEKDDAWTGWGRDRPAGLLLMRGACLVVAFVLSCCPSLRIAFLAFLMLFL